MINNPTEDPKDHPHWKGWKNKAIRYYFYCNKGLDTFNNFRYVGMMIFGVYWTLKLKCAWWLLVMFGICIPMLTVIGYYSIHHINKVQDWLNVRFGTHYGLASFKLQEETRDAVQYLAQRCKEVDS